MPTIYKYMMPIVVDQERYNVLITRPGYFASATPDPGDGTNRVGGVSKTDQRLAGKFPYRRPKVLTHVTSMQTSHGWTAGNALASDMNDTSDYALGSQSAYITSKTDTTAATLTSGTIALDMSATKTLRLLLKVTGSDNIQGLTLYATSDAFAANYAICNVQNVTADPSVRWLKDGEWKWVTVNMASSNAQTGSVTGTPNFGAINQLRLRLTTTTGTSATVRLQAVQVVERPSFADRGIVVFTYDDSYRAQYTIAKAHLDKYGFPATAFTIHSNVTDADNGNSAWLTTQMLKDLRAYSRWEIALHTDTLANHSRAFAAGTNSQSGTVYGTNPLSYAELDTDITNELEWLMAQKLTDGFVGHCYPQGRFNTTVREQMANRVAYARAMTANSNGVETVPPADPYAIRCITLDNNSNIANLQAIVDSVAQHGGMVVFCCHNIVTTPGASTEFKTADHATLVDYVASKPGIRVMTLGDVMRSTTAQDYATVDQTDLLQVGEAVCDRRNIVGSGNTYTSQQMQLTYFTARKTSAINNVTMYTHTTAASGLTLARIGVYSVAANGDLTLVASTASDTNLFIATTTKYTKALSATWTKQAGQRYALAVLCVGTTMPTFIAVNAGGASHIDTIMGAAPAQGAQINSQTDLPSTLSAGSVAASRRLPYFEMTP